jgi:integrase
MLGAKSIHHPQGEQAAKISMIVAVFAAFLVNFRPTLLNTAANIGSSVCRCAAVPLRELERMTDEVAAWASQQPPGVRYGRMSALRQCLSAAVRWGHIAQNPAVLAGKNRPPEPRAIRVYSRAELDAIALELGPQYAPLPQFAAVTGPRPGEWMALERRDVDRRAGMLYVRTRDDFGPEDRLAKTSNSRRQLPLSPRALTALDMLPARLGTPLLFPSPEGNVMRLSNFSADYWRPAIEAAGIRRPARIYDLRRTFASNALAGGIAAFELAKIMGTSVAMIERHYGSLLDGAGASIAQRLASLEAEQDRASDQAVRERREDV